MEPVEAVALTLHIGVAAFGYVEVGETHIRGVARYATGIECRTLSLGTLLKLSFRLEQGDHEQAKAQPTNHGRKVSTILAPPAASAVGLKMLHGLIREKLLVKIHQIQFLRGSGNGRVEPAQETYIKHLFG